MVGLKVRRTHYFWQSEWQIFGRAGKWKCEPDKNTQQALAEMPEANETNKQSTPVCIRIDRSEWQILCGLLDEEKIHCFG